MNERVILKHGNQDGVALLTVLLLLLIMTVLGIAAITVTGLENRMAGFFRTGEAAAAAAESCEGTAANIIQQTIAPGQLPGGFAGTVVNIAFLQSEILGQPLPPPANTPSENNADAASTEPNITLTNVPGFQVNGDIDRLYIHKKPGMDAKAEGSNEILYRITCIATNAATGASSTITSVYGCTVYSTGCYKKL